MHKLTLRAILLFRQLCHLFHLFFIFELWRHFVFCDHLSHLQFHPSILSFYMTILDLWLTLFSIEKPLKLLFYLLKMLCITAVFYAKEYGKNWYCSYEVDSLVPLWCTPISIDAVSYVAFYVSIRKLPIKYWRNRFCA